MKGSAFNGARMRLRSKRGFTLIELLVTMMIFIIVIILSSQAFERIIGSASQESKKAESNINGIVGLEMMRTDLEHAGYGLPWVLTTPASFLEMDSTQVPANSLAPGITSTSFNDSALSTTIDANKVPRAIQSGTGATGIAYLVVKSVITGMNATSKKWAYVQYSGSGGTNSYIKKWNTSDDFVPGEFVVTLNSSTRQLVANSTSSYNTSYYYLTTANGTNPLNVPSGYGPTFNTDVDITYGVADHSSTAGLRMPYNRTDYYVSTPPAGMSPRCAPGTGNLYKAVVNHSDGSVTSYPLLECIADMQVVYSLDTNGDGAVDFHTTDISQLSAQSIRSQLKEVRVYFLTHEGKADRNFAYPSSTVDVGETIWGSFSGRHFDLTSLPGIGSHWQNYRWKVYQMVVIPKNLSQ